MLPDLWALYLRYLDQNDAPQPEKGLTVNKWKVMVKTKTDTTFFSFVAVIFIL